MAEPTLNYVDCPDTGTGHRMAYWQWGDAKAEHTVVCVHGLTRQGRDFDTLARSLVARSPHPLQVVCPDVAGRGESDRLADPQAYAVPTYVSDLLALLAQLRPATLDWVGTSMGGLIGIAVCSLAESIGLSVRRLVLNDVGPVIEWESLQRIGGYVGKAMEFESLEHAAEALWEISQSFGPHTPAQWLDLTRPMLRPAQSGGVRLHYDPAIAASLSGLTQEASAQGEAMLWRMYDAIVAPTLLLRGAESDLLSPETAQQMCARGPRARLVEFPGVGHAPTLIAPEQLEAVVSFLLG